MGNHSRYSFLSDIAIHSCSSTMRSVYTILTMVFLILMVGSTWTRPKHFLIETNDAAVDTEGYRGGPVTSLYKNTGAIEPKSMDYICPPDGRFLDYCLE